MSDYILWKSPPENANMEQTMSPDLNETWLIFYNLNQSIHPYDPVFYASDPVLAILGITNESLRGVVNANQILV
jgi:hypothetical protein